MFLESITLSGILEINDSKTQNFSYPRNINNTTSENEDVEDNDVNLNIKMEFIIGFSLVFDSTYDSTYDFSQYITSSSKCEPVVEIVLWQRTKLLDSKHSWLSQNELKLRRNLKQPQFVFIGNKKFPIKDFHQSLANLGFLNIDNLNIHRLLESEIQKLRYLLRDDLWNMLMKIIACEELIEMAERKNDTVKKRIMKRTYDDLSNTVCKVLPKKVKLRYDIQNQLLLRNSLFTLLHIITERQFVILNYQIGSHTDKLDPFVIKLKEDFYQQHKKQKYIVSVNQQKENLRNMSFQIDNNQIDVEQLTSLHLLNDYTCNTPTIEVYSDIMLDMKKMIEEHTDKEEKGFDYEETGWKLILESGNEEDSSLLDSIINVATEVQLLKNEFQKNYEHQFQEENLTKTFIDEQSQFMSRDKRIFDSLQEIEERNLENRNNIADILEILTDKAFDAYIPMSFKKALLAIEDIVKADKNLSRDYLGPVFQYLKSSTDIELDRHIWQQILEASQSILFKTGESARKFTDDLYDMRTSLRCQIISFDECPEEIDLEEPTQNQDKYIFAQSLIDPNTPSEVKKMLPYILRKFIFVEDEDWVYENELEKWYVTCYNDICSTVYYEGSTSVVSQLPNQTKVSSIKAVQEMHENLKKRTVILSSIKENNEKAQEITTQLYEEEQSIEKHSNRMREKFFSESVNSLNLMLSKFHFTPRTKMLERLNNIKRNVGTEIDKEELQRKLLDCDYESTSFYRTDHELMKPMDILRMFTHNIYGPSFQLFNDISLETRNANKELSQYKLDVLKKRRDKLDNAYKINRQTSMELLTLENTPLGEKDDLIDRLESCLEFGKVYAQREVTRASIKTIDKKVNHSDVNDMISFNQDIFNQLKNHTAVEIINKAEAIRDQLLTEKNETEIRLRHLTMDSYVNLVDSIRKVRKFAEEDVFTPVEIKKRAFPLMNALVVKLLRDTVYHFKTTYNVIFSDFLSQSSLFFYTHGSINETIEDDQFSWSCFDMTRIKSIDFAEKWNDEFRSKVSVEKVKQLKAFLLILHIINYISLFKFIIISSNLFEDMDTALEKKVRAFLKTVSSYIQVIIIERSVERQPSPEPMDVSL